MQTFTKQLYFLALFLLLLTLRGTAQYWMQKGGSSTVDEGYDIGIDGNGNTYTVGYFTGTASFGSNSISSSGGTDIFLVKTNSQGVYQWAVKAGGSGADRGLSIEVDGSGNSYITGYFTGTASFGSSTVTSEGLTDVFIAKYNSSGALQWVVGAGGSESDQGSGIDVDNSGNAVVTGEFRDTASFGSTDLVSAGGTDVFITKVSSSGSFTWTEHGTGVNSQRGIDVACDNSGNIYGTGQFSGNITFDVAHTNTMFNAVFIVKYNSSGAEQWFRVIGAGGSNIGNAITCDGSGNTYITGDFTGTTTFFGSTNVTLTGNYDNHIFVAKYNSNGALQWTQASSSKSDLTSRSIAIDGNGNSYICGHFKCRLEDYSDQYGSGIFNTIGYWDVFVAKFTSSGSWSYSRHAGGRSNDYAFGVDVNSSGNIHYTGSFTGTFNVPTSDNFINSNLNLWSEAECTGNAPYCGDDNYDQFHRMTSAGNLDIAIANCFDPDREPYDFYQRSGSNCVRDSTNVCINAGCPDSVEGCVGVFLNAILNYCPNVGPQPAWSWWNVQLANGQSATTTTTGYKALTLQSQDGCFATTDSIYVTIIPPPSPPLISDDVVINTNTNMPDSILVCGPDTVTLTGSGFNAGDSVFWIIPPDTIVDSIITVDTTGTYTFMVIDENGCNNATTVPVVIFEPLDTLLLKIKAEDSVEICDGEPVTVWLYDSISNPFGAQICLTQFEYEFESVWTLDPDFEGSPTCETVYNFYPDTTGVVTFNVNIIQYTPCDTLTYTVTDSMYVEVFPVPDIDSFQLNLTGSQFFCPGDSTTLYASGGPNYTWSGDGINGVTDSIVQVWQEDAYSVNSFISDTNQYGCVSTFSGSLAICVDEKPQPELNADTTLICPGDSILLSVSHPSSGAPCYYTVNQSAGIFSWVGPSGPLASTNEYVYVTEPGNYYCIFTDTDSCALQTNTIELTQYATPQLLGNGDLTICEGDSAVISVVSNDGSLIEWQPPLSGNGTHQTVYEPGIYTCHITSCGILTEAEIQVFPSDVASGISGDTHLCDIDTTVLSGNPGLASYLWYPGGQTTQNITITQGGQFVLTVLDSSDCQATSDTFNVLQGQAPTEASVAGYPVFCEGDSIVIYGSDSMENYLWTPGGYTTQNITTFTPGTYVLSTVDSNGCRGDSDPIEVKSPSTIAPITIVGDTFFCEGDHVILDADAKGKAIYVWTTPDSVIGKTLYVQESGTYHLTTIDTFGCVAFSKKVGVHVEPSISSNPLANDTIICRGNAVTLEATTDVGEIHWYDDTGTELLETGPEFTTPVLDHNTTYYIWSVKSYCESKSIPVLVEVINCESVNVPNVLTPNGDGINDIWRVALEEHTCFRCYIYNRWGELLFTSNHIGMGWDGRVTNTGLLAPEGVYYYIVDYCLYDGREAQQRGVVHLLPGNAK